MKPERTPDVSYSLHREGQPVEDGFLRRIQRIEVEEHLDKADMLRLELATNVRDGSGGWELLDDGTFEPFTHLQFGIRVGDGTDEFVLDAYVIDLNVDLSADPGRSTIEVVAMDRTAKMNREEKTKRWEKMRDSAVAEELFNEHDVTPKDAGIEKTEPSSDELEAPLMQRGTDAQLLRKLAERNGYVFYVETDTAGKTEHGFFHPLARKDTGLDEEAQPPLYVSMGADTNVVSFDVRHEMTRPYRAVGSGVKASDKEKQNASADDSGDTSLGRTSTLTDSRAERLVTARLGQRTGDIQSYGQALTDRSSYAIRATGRLRPVRYGHVLRAKRPVQVQGAGKKFSVGYYVERVQHTITDREYVQDFRLRSNARDAKENAPVQPAPGAPGAGRSSP